MGTNTQFAGFRNAVGIYSVCTEQAFADIIKKLITEGVDFKFVCSVLLVYVIFVMFFHYCLLLLTDSFSITLS